jgi:AAA domain
VSTTQDLRATLEARGNRLLRELTGYLDAGGGLAIVKAPPGSGKTHLLLQAVRHVVERGLRVAVATQTNTQADDVCRRLAADHPTVPVCRFLSSSGGDPGLPVAVRVVRSSAQLPVGPSVSVGTTAKWGLSSLAAPFDLLFVDEAWQMAWADFMLCGLVSGRFVLIGDPGQIPPTVTVPVQRWETSPRAPHQAAPQLLLDDPTVKAFEGDLPACRRLPADAVDLVRPFYDFDFEAWARDGERSVDPGRRPRPGGTDDVDAAIDLLATGSVAALAVATPKEGPPLEEDMALARAAAGLAVRLLDRGARAVDQEGGRPEPLRPVDIGLAATHRVMNSAMVQALPDGLHRQLRVDTPERWQGLERKVMIVVHPLSGVTRPSAFDLETGRLCVMASRHRAGMVVVTRDHVPDTLSGYVPRAEQAVGRPDVSGRGHHQHCEFWDRLERNGRVAAA